MVIGIYSETPLNWFWKKIDYNRIIIGEIFSETIFVDFIFQNFRNFISEFIINDFIINNNLPLFSTRILSEYFLLPNSERKKGEVLGNPKNNLFDFILRLWIIIWIIFFCKGGNRLFR